MSDSLVGSVLRGSFTSATQSGSIPVSSSGTLDLDFGSGSVTLQRQSSNGNWIDVKDATYTADTAVNIDGCGRSFRLNCTSWTTEIFYTMSQ